MAAGGMTDIPGVVGGSWNQTETAGTGLRIHRGALFKHNRGI